ncbi:protein of unknown function [Dyadobacter sp. SG02]|uniref:DUF4160 domain-containing protein n=1 Tax=Dyadobacter sp. SG02 TaxID=1855291 RepID=UPI0008C08288|nr:DUF4160 domain-containing protein [Dyadobacter sp. SG02]SEJ10361.1 protein of unknown function [Dyadobacter sp. SG02]
MPEIFRMFGMKFFFYSLEHLPIHIHVRNADGTAKFEVNPVRLIESRGIKPKDLMLAEALVEQHSELIIEKWHEFHG